MVSASPVVLTGAAGVLGQYLRPRLAARPEGLRSNDIRDPGPAVSGEEIIVGDLADPMLVDKLVKGASSIVHLGGISAEDDVEKIFHSNLRGTFNVFDAAKRQGVRRIVFASSVHAIGYYRVDERLDSFSCAKPDTIYGVSKAFGEDLGKFYAAKFGLEVACMRIGSVEPAPRDVRHLSTWLSFDDMVRLVFACLDAPSLTFTIVYGASGNKRSWWDNTKSGIDYQPQDDAEAFVGRIAPNGDMRDQTDAANQYQGGFCIHLDVGERAIR